MTGVTIRQLVAPADAAWAAVERIYVDALPAGERKPIAWLRSLADRSRPGGAAGRYAALIAERVGTVLGFGIVFLPDRADDAALLEYLAVTADARGGGVGGRLFAAALAAAGGRPMLVEVEADDPDGDRRRAFYRRHGCVDLLDVDYTLPLPGAPPMRLMVAGAAVVRRHDLVRWLSTVYAEVYGQPRDDPRPLTMVAGVADPAVVG